MTRIGLIGVGTWGINHLRALTEIDCDLVCIADVDSTKAALAKQHGIPFFHDYQPLLSTVDAVVVTTPTDTHVQIVKDCLAAGKHVFVEKPMAATAAQSRALEKLAESQKLVLSVGYLYRFNNAIRRARELIKEAGELQYLTARYIHSTKPPRTDSGVIMNLGIHVIDILNFLTERTPSRIYAKKKNLLSDSYEDSAAILLDYNDFFATIELSCTHPEKARDLWIIAGNEKIYLDYFSQKIMRYPLKVSYNEVEREEPIVEEITANEPLKDELQYFVSLIDQEETQPELNKGRENWYTTRICELCLESAQNGTELPVK
ncbi:MAG: Gfo/Idh/MocA family oxidoreductase [Methanomicrobia archaeon]|nr:Gfo/Idh/MocA family oxidoreductase [Methanomicrobia archaeon]